MVHLHQGLGHRLHQDLRQDLHHGLGHGLSQIRRTGRVVSVARAVRDGVSRHLGIVVVLLALALGAGVMVADAVPAWSQPSGQPTIDYTVNYTVQPGDTLWSIAQRVAPRKQDVPAMVQRISELNALPDSTLQSGQHLKLPDLSA